MTSFFSRNICVSPTHTIWIMYDSMLYQTEERISLFLSYKILKIFFYQANSIFTSLGQIYFAFNVCLCTEKHWMMDRQLDRHPGGLTARWSTDNGEVIPVPVCLCKQHNKPTCIVQVDLHKSSVQRLSMNKIYALWIEKYRKVSWKHCAHFKVSRIF